MKRRPIFARFYEAVAEAGEAELREHREATAGGARGRVLEIGAGNGLNFAYYPSGTTVVGLDPEPIMLRNAAPRARDATARVALIRASAEALPFRDGVFETVVLTLTLCSIPDVGAAAREARRVLAPDGEVRFFEHVRAPDPRVARWQDRIDRPWGWLAGGCHPNRDTLGLLRRTGFRVRYRRFGFGSRVLPTYDHVVGVARLP